MNLTRKQDELDAMLDSIQLETELQTWEGLQLAFSEIKWAWHRWLPMGYVTMLAAAPGVGKSLLALTICKLVTKGGQFPDGYSHEVQTDDIRRVLWVETESGEPFHVGRARQIDLDLSSIVTPQKQNEPDKQFTLTSHVDRQRIEAIANLDTVKMVVIDSLSGGHALDENSASTGQVVQWLSALAKKTGKPFLVIHHMNKSGMQTTSEPPTMAAIRGSTSLLQHARVIWTLDCPDATKPTDLRLACAKSNLGARAKPISIGIDGLGRLVWLGASENPHDSLDKMVLDLQKHNPTLTTEQLADLSGLSVPTIAGIVRATKHTSRPLQSDFKGLNF